MNKAIFQTKAENIHPAKLIERLKESPVSDKVNNSLLLIVSDNYYETLLETSKKSMIKVNPNNKEIKLVHFDEKTQSSIKTSLKIDTTTRNGYYVITKIESSNPKVGTIYKRDAKNEPTYTCCFVRSPERGMGLMDKIDRANRSKKR